MGITRRDAARALAAWIAASPLLAQESEPKLIGEAPGRIAPRTEIVNTFELEAMAQRSLSARLFAEIEGSGDRSYFHRITFRPRMLFDVHQLDLSVDLLGSKMYAPVIVGPVSGAGRFHPDGELSLVRGAAAAQAAVMISSRSGMPIEKIAAEAKSPLWYQLHAEDEMKPVIAAAQKAVAAGCRAVCLSSARMTWPQFDQLRQAVKVPLVIKGVMTPQDAQAAVEHGAGAVVVSSYSEKPVPGAVTPIEALAPVVDAIGAKVPVLVDGGFRRGTDVMAALALGARGVLVARPALWGLAAYGAEGVAASLQMLQSETARDMSLCGKRDLKALDRSLLRIDKL